VLFSKIYKIIGLTSEDTLIRSIFRFVQTMNVHSTFRNVTENRS